jgi:hypothetical protein
MFGGTMVLDFMDFADVSELADPRQLPLHVSTSNDDILIYAQIVSGCCSHMPGIIDGRYLIF